jgi:hypothetical protein
MAKNKAKRETPIRLVDHKIDERSAGDLYKTGHEVVFKRGGEKSPGGLELYVGWVSTGGLANQVASDGEGSRYVVWRAYPDVPEGESSEVHGVWLNGGEPSAYEVEGFVKDAIRHITSEQRGSK